MSLEFLRPSSIVQSTIFVVSVSDVTSKWVGESARLVRIIFQLARKCQPAIIFFDEVDVLCRNRNSNVSTTSNSNEQTAELLAQMDGAGFDNSGIVFMGATNLPWIMDPAFRRRFDKTLYVGMPDDAARLKLLRLELDNYWSNDFDNFQNEFISITSGMTGSDIKRVAQEALKMPLREIEAATCFHKLIARGGPKDNKYISVNPAVYFACSQNCYCHLADLAGADGARQGVNRIWKVSKEHPPTLMSGDL
jgi:vacuolar protein-sorting-associated protein 4